MVRKKKRSVWQRYSKWATIAVVAVVAVAWVSYYVIGPKPRIAVIRVDGVIWDTRYEDLAYEAMRDPCIKAVVIEIDSVGGGKDACFGTELAFRELSQVKPVVVTMKDYAASGAYLVSSPADYIFARGGTITASLGVYARWVCLENKWKEEGYEFFVWKSGVAKDAFASYRRPTEEENKYLDDLIKNTMDNLINRIKNNRPQVVDEIENLEEGYFFKSSGTGVEWSISGEEALELQLVDEIGDSEDAIQKAAELAGLKTYTIVELKAESHTMEPEIEFTNLENRIMLL